VVYYVRFSCASYLDLDIAENDYSVLDFEEYPALSLKDIQALFNCVVAGRFYFFQVRSAVYFGL